MCELPNKVLQYIFLVFHLIQKILKKFQKLSKRVFFLNTKIILRKNLHWRKKYSSSLVFSIQNWKTNQYFIENMIRKSVFTHIL